LKIAAPQRLKPQKIRVRTEIKIKGSGQECPLYTGGLLIQV